jgi:hypothetical protein
MLNRQEEVKQIKELLKYIPYAPYYKQLLAGHPDSPLFDWIDQSKL